MQVERRGEERRGEERYVKRRRRVLLQFALGRWGLPRRRMLLL